MKEMNRRIDQMNLQNHSMVKVRLGAPKNEGQYDIELHEIILRDGLPDSKYYD